MEIVFTILACIVFAFVSFLCFQTINSDKSKSEKFIAITTTIVTLFLLIVALFGARESIKYKTMQDYFEGKVEVIEQIDTTRTFKFS